MITFRQDLQTMKDKLTGITAAMFNELSDSVESVLTNLNNKIDSTIDSLGMRGTWNDNVSIEINGGVRTGFKNVIESCKTPACELIDSIGVNSESLFMKLTEYINKFSEYKKLLKEKDDLVKSEPPKTIYNSRKKEEEPNADWSSWKEKLDLLEFAIKAMEITIQGIESLADSLINSLKSMLGPITASSTAAISLFSSNEEFVDDNVKKISNKYVNDDGTVTENYTLYDSIGNEIGVGNIKYDQMGNKIIEEYSKILPDGSRKNATITYENGKATEVSTIVNKDGTVVQSGDSFIDNTTSEDVQKLIEENSKKTEEIPTTTSSTTDVQKVTETTTYPIGFTEQEKSFLNDNANDKNMLRLFYNGEEIADNSHITIKKGETIQVLVKIPTNEGEHIDLCRASTGGGEAYKSGGLRQSNSVSPNRYDKNAMLKDTGYYVWTITGEEGGTYQISQTAQFNTERRAYYNSEKGNGAFKEMCNLFIKVE